MPQGTEPEALGNVQPTAALSGSDTARDSDGVLDATRKISRSAVFTAPALGNEDLTRDFGFVPVVRLGNFVWHDANGDGVQNEPFSNNLANVLVQLRRANDGAVLGEQRTNVDGVYEFNSLTTAGLEPNTAYTLTVPLDEASNAALATFVPTLPTAGSDTSVDSDGVFERNASPAPRAVRQNAQTGAFGTFADTFDFGFVQPLSIGDFLFVDLNGDGVQNDGGGGVPGATVTLMRGNSQVASVTTDSAGKYLFTEREVAGLVPATAYRVEVAPLQTALSNFRPTLANRGNNDALDSDASPNDDPLSVPVTTAASGVAQRADLTIDFGFEPLQSTVKLGDFVWLDQNRNGAQDAGEPGVAGVTLSLRDQNGEVTSTVTDANGRYEFTSGETAATATGVEANTDYTIVINLIGPLSGLQATRVGGAGGDTTRDSNGVHTSATFVTADARTGALGSDDRSFDFGFVPVFEIGDFVWSDVDGDGVQDAGEPGIAGVTVTLEDVATGDVVRSQLTDNDVSYIYIYIYILILFFPFFFKKNICKL